MTRWIVTAALLLSGCSDVPGDPGCALEKLGGRSGTVAYNDPSQPWPCGQAPANATGCRLTSDVCETPIRWDCGELDVELGAETLTVSNGACVDAHAIHWVAGE